jgi:GntR family transcriptional regulator, vanillate catabolism transcriptional regulator
LSTENTPRASAQTATARATLALRQMLVQGRFQPGEWIREVPLAKELKVTRFPLHLALERLAREGFLEVRPNRGFVTARFSIEDIYESIDVRGLLEGAAARLATQRMKDVGDLGSMRKASSEMLELVRHSRLTIHTLETYIRLNATFHTTLLDLSESRMLRRSIEQLCALPFASPEAFLEAQCISLDSRELFLIAADEHCRIVEAISNRDGARAEALAREHARIARRNLESALRNRNVAPDEAARSLIALLT